MFIPDHLFSIIILMHRPINGVTVSVGSSFLRDPPPDASSSFDAENNGKES
jgi:hypothetical protein